MRRNAREKERERRTKARNNMNEILNKTQLASSPEYINMMIDVSTYCYCHCYAIWKYDMKIFTMILVILFSATLSPYSMIDNGWQQQ